MAEITSGTQGDAVSRMLQLESKQLKLDNIRWTGKGYDDVRAVLIALDDARTLRDALLRGVTDIMHMKETGELPEAVQARLAMIVLNARAEIDLKTANRNPPPKVPA